MAKLAKPSPGPWEVDTIDNDGTYGDGPDCHSGFKSYAVYDANGKVLFDSLNAEVAEIDIEYDDMGAYVWDRVSEANLTLAGASHGMLTALETVLARAVRGEKLTTGDQAIVASAISKATGRDVADVVKGV